MKYPQALENLINELSKFPGVGLKTAERYAFYLLKYPQKSKNLSQALNELPQKIKVCQSCLALSETDPCPICSSKNRDDKTLCLVENIQDLIAIENTKQYQGHYFILGGLLDTINNIQAQDLNIKKLIKKIKEEDIKEIILALNFTLEGETTTLYLDKLLKGHLKITHLAKGLPAGSSLEYVDELTLSSALKNRKKIK